MGLLDKYKKILKINALIVGIENSGKTALLNFLTPDADDSIDEIKETVPTTGMNTGELRFNKLNIKIDIKDMAGQAQYRKLWESPLMECNAVIFMINIADPSRYESAKDAFEKVAGILRNRKTKNKIPICIALNKIDLLETNDTVENEKIINNKIDEMIDFLKVQDFVGANNPYHIIATSATRGNGLKEMLLWLIQQTTGKTIQFDDIIFDEFMVFQNDGTLLVSKATFLGKDKDTFVPELMFIINSCVKQFGSTEDFDMTIKGKILLSYTIQNLVGMIVISSRLMIKKWLRQY